MENSAAYKGLQEILLKLDSQELIGLAATVTQGFLKNKIETTEDSIGVIVKYSTNLRSILRRKVVTKNLLFEYLHENNVPVKLPVTKNDLIDIICEFWNYQAPPTLASTAVALNEETNSTYSSSTSQDDPEISAMALKFVEWFYSMMNLGAPLDCSHFWSDAKLTLNIISGIEITNNTMEDVEEIVQLLFTTKCEHNLYFNPNLLSDGVQGRIDAHGLVVVMSCGTLHSNNICVGVYEQVFMLARDPTSDNNWKIKNTQLNLKSKSGIIAPPSLYDSNLTNRLLALPNR